MKYTLFLLLLIGSAKAQSISDAIQNQKQHIRHFFIGYIGTTKDNNVFDGGDSVNVPFYPNVFVLADHYKQLFHLHDVRILSITEQTDIEYRQFWHEPNELKSQIDFFKKLRK